MTILTITVRILGASLRNAHRMGLGKSRKPHPSLPSAGNLVRNNDFELRRLSVLCRSRWSLLLLSRRRSTYYAHTCLQFTHIHKRARTLGGENVRFTITTCLTFHENGRLNALTTARRHCTLYVRMHGENRGSPCACACIRVESAL